MRLENSISWIGAAWIATLAPAASATDFVVNPGQSIQAAIQLAGNGDRVLVQPGTYLEHSLELLGKSIELIGVGGAGQTIVDGGGAVVVSLFCTSGEPQTAVVAGLTLRNCVTGILIDNGAKPTIRGCVIEDHLTKGLTGLLAYAGDGIHATNLAPDARVFECVVRDNEGSGVQGKVHLTRCTVSGNQDSGYRAQVGANGAGSLRECRIIGNSGALGGGISILGDNVSGNPATNQVIDRCVIAGNSALTGGGVYGQAFSGLQVTNSWIADNVASGAGGGVFLSVSDLVGFGTSASSAVRNCVVTRNAAGTTGGGVFLEAIADPPLSPVVGSTTLYRTTLSGNLPDGAVLKGAVSNSVTNCIAWHQPSPFSGSPYVVAFSDVEGGHIGVGNFDADPLFVDEALGDYHLRTGSPCIGAGFGAATSDFEGDASAGAVDVGGDEFAPHVAISGDTAPGGSVRLGIYGQPGSAPVLLFLSATRLDPGIPTPYGPFGLGFPLLAGFPVSLGSIPAGSAIAIPTTIPALAPHGLALHMQVFLGNGGGATPKLTPVESFVIG